jgi:hypothetical protein
MTSVDLAPSSRPAFNSAYHFANPPCEDPAKQRIHRLTFIVESARLPENGFR